MLQIGIPCSGSYINPWLTQPKKTPEGEIMDKWTEYSLGELLTYEQPTPYIVESTDYDDKYKTPVLTAGKSFVLGYTDEDFGIYDALPVIIFDDFTTATQYVNFPFKVKSSAMKILTANTELVLPKFIYYRMQIIEFDHSTHKRYWIQQYSKNKVQIPSIPEQERIVARIEELFSQLDSGMETLKKTKQQLVVYRQAVFNSIINQYSGEECKLQEIAETIDGDRGINYPKKSDFFEQGDCLFLTAQNVKPYGWDFNNNIFLTKSKDTELHSGKLQRNDVVITTRGTLGNIAIYNDNVPYEHVRINSCMLILRPNISAISSDYLAHYLMSPMFKKQIARLKSGTAQPQIPAKVLKQTVLLVPSSKDQQAIVEKLKQHLSVCDRIEQTVNTALQQAEAMRQSILKDAFEGRL